MARAPPRGGRVRSVAGAHCPACPAASAPGMPQIGAPRHSWRMQLGAISPPVVRVTLRPPIKVSGSILRTAVALVGEFTVSELTDMPLPKFAVVVPWAK